jgi:hypothetical protein
MRSLLTRVQTGIARHPRLVATLLVVTVFLAAAGGAAALDGAVGMDGATLGDVGTTDSGTSSAGPTDP